MHHSDTEVEINQENGKAVIQGKTSVPFKTFVSLILQRKVQTLFKKWQDEPVIVGTELLTGLASAPDDSTEDRGKLVIVTLGVGVILGVFLTTGVLFVLTILKIVPSMAEYGLVLFILVCLSFLLSVMQRSQKSSTKQKLYEKMERVTDVLSR